MTRRGPSSQPPVPTAPIEIILSVEISDGSLSSKVRVPIDATETEREKAVARWFEIIMFGLKQRGTEIEIVAAFPKEGAVP